MHIIEFVIGCSTSTIEVNDRQSNQREHAIMSSLDPTFLFLNLIPNQAAFSAIVGDRNLTLDDFAAKHRHTLHAHFAQRDNDLDSEWASQAAAELWRYIQSLLSWTDNLVATVASTECRILTGE